MLDFLAEFISFMTAQGLAPAEKIIPDDKIHRYKILDQTKRNGTYQIRIDAQFAVGWCRSHAEGITHKWNSKGGKMTPAERAAAQDRIALERKRHEANALEAQLQATRKAQQMYKNARRGDSTYIRRKQIEYHCAKMLGGTLLIPMYENRAVVNVQKIACDGSKMFLTGGKVNGCYCPLGSGVEGSIVICEGFATGATINEVTGLPVAVAFSAANLLHVGRKMRKRYPDAEIIFAADNDQWTKKPDGTSFNPGRESANKAADAVGGRVIYPVVDSEHPSRPTDWNDIFRAEGPERLKAEFEIPKIVEKSKATIVIDEGEAPFRILGYDGMDFYYMPKSGKQIIALSASAHSISNLLYLAPLAYWEENYGAKDTSHSKVALAATNSLINGAHRRGIFSPDSLLRGCGAWIDAGRNVMHCGDTLHVNGEVINPYNFKSDYIYNGGKKILNFNAKPLRSSQAIQLKEICDMLKWENPLSAGLLAGWCVVAPVCAMLPWRPHIWISCQSGGGKSTIMDKIIKPILGEMAVHESGGTTEAGIRQIMGHDGRPVIYDEADAENQRDEQIMSGVLFLARRSSSGATLTKGTQDGKGAQFMVRSCFCFASINISMKKRADETRVSILSLKKSTDEEHFDRLITKIRATLTPEFSRALLARTVAHLDTLIENCATFTDAAAIVLKDRRAAEQVGTMCAGLRMLYSTEPISLDDAKAWLRLNNLENYTAIGEDTDQERLISFLSMQTMRVVTLNATMEVTIGILIACAIGRNTKVNQSVAAEELKTIGIMYRGDYVCVSNTSSRISKLLQGTVWSAKWGRTLADLKGAKRMENMFFTPGHKARAVGIPIGHFTDDVQEELL